jgi:purine-binding chemotaxis protein CheW
MHESETTAVAVPAAEVDRRGPARSDLGGRYLVFTLQRSSYGLDITKAREIIGAKGITPVPRMPDHVTGVIHLRGRVIPVLDLRLAFGLAKTPSTNDTSIVIVDVGPLVGIIVDAVEGVADLPARDVQSPEHADTSIRADWLLGVGSFGGKDIALLDVDRVLMADQVDEIASVVTRT